MREPSELSHYFLPRGLTESMCRPVWHTRPGAFESKTVHDSGGRPHGFVIQGDDVSVAVTS